MQTKILLSVFLFCTATFSFAQKANTNSEIPTKPEKAWKCTGVVGLNASAVGLWNWAEGGSPSANGVIFANVNLLYKKNKIAWESNFNSDFGLLYTDNSTFAWRNSNDKIIFNTKLGYAIAKTWYITAMGSFRSQYAKGYEYITKDGIDSRNYISKW
ncbi:MAG: DUF3078 domain-containing protein, partial [Bacteroidales bacterium]